MSTQLLSVSYSKLEDCKKSYKVTDGLYDVKKER